MNNLTTLKNLIENCEKICVFTGAGISCPSGIPDFRSADGIYNEKTNCIYSPEQIISHSCFCKDPQIFFDFYKSKMVYPDAKPNKAHLYFANLENRGKEIKIVTQNIDGLHSEAGNTKVFEIHGTIKRNYCTNCNKEYDEKFIVAQKDIPLCSECKSIIKPDVVLYEEPLNQLITDSAIHAIKTCDLLIIIGTSLAVYPAASFVNFFKGKSLVLINKTPTPFDEKADLVIYDDIINVIEHLESV